MDPTVNVGEWLGLLSPALLVAIVGIVIMMIEAVARPERKGGLAALAMGGVFAAMGLVCWTTAGASPAIEAFGGMVRIDAYGGFFQLVALLAGMLSLLMSDSYLERIGLRVGEYYALVMFGVCGMMLMSIANDLMMVFISLEVMSISMYVLSALKRADQKSVESGFKYFVLGSFSSAIMLYGIAMLYGATGSTALPAISHAIAAPSGAGTLIAVGGILLIVGFGFKVASVPFHMWAPDVYQGAPTSVTALMASGVKAASFAAFGRVVLGAMGLHAAEWTGALWWMAALTMVVGNLGALVQEDVKRMLAYSSIAHAGYLLMALSSAGELGATNPAMSSLLFYMLAYTFMNAGAFAILSLMTHEGEDKTNLTDLAGLGRSNPGLAAAMSLFLLSLAGIPPTMGFIGKFYLFTAAVQGGQVGLAIIGALAAATGVYYYLRPMIWMYMKDGAPIVHRDVRTTVVVALSVAAMLLFGLMPASVLDWAAESVRSVAS